MLSGSSALASAGQIASAAPVADNFPLPCFIEIQPCLKTTYSLDKMADEEVDWGMDDGAGYDDDCLSVGDGGEFAECGYRQCRVLTPVESNVVVDAATIAPSPKAQSEKTEKPEVKETTELSGSKHTGTSKVSKKHSSTSHSTRHLTARTTAPQPLALPV